MTTPPPASNPRTPQTSSLTDIKGVGPVTADKLTDAGFRDVAAVAAATSAELAGAVGTSEATAAKWIASAKSLT